MLPEITVPAGSSEVPHNEADDETWYFTAPYDQAAAMIKAQLPIGRTFRGVPYCKGDNDLKPGAEIVAWDWSTDTEDLWISVTGPSLAINKNKLGEILFRWQPVTDGSGRQQDCTAPLPDSYSPQPPPGPRSTSTNNSAPLPHSDKAEIDLPPGTWLAPSNPETVKTNSEIWYYDVSQADMVAWLTARLPIGQPFHASAFCADEPPIEGQTSWEWIGGGQRFYVQVTDYNMVEFQRGSMAGGCP
jgi:hypothetical protein